MKEKINCAIIGTRFGVRTILPAVLKVKCLNIKYLCGGKDKEKTRMIAQKYSIKNFGYTYEDIINDNEIKIVFVATPHVFHYEMIKKAIQKEKIVLTEKPLGIDEFEVNDIVELAKKSNKLMLVNHQLNYYPVFNKIKEKLNLLGEVYYMKIYYQTNRLTYLNEENWTLDSKKGGGLYLAIGSHILSLLSFLFNNDLEVTSSYYDNFKSGCAETLFEFQGFINSLKINVMCVGTAYSDDYLEIKIFGKLGEINFKSNSEAVLIYLNKEKEIEKEDLYEDVDKSVSIWKLSFENYLFKIINDIKNENNIYNDKRNTSFEEYQKQFILLKKLKKDAKNSV